MKTIMPIVKGWYLLTFPETLNLKLSSTISVQEGHRKMSVNIRSTDKKGIPQPGSFSLAVAQTF